MNEIDFFLKWVEEPFCVTKIILNIESGNWWVDLRIDSEKQFVNTKDTKDITKMLVITKEYEMDDIILQISEIKKLFKKEI